MNDQELRMKCIEEARLIAMLVGETRTVMEIAKEIYDWVTGEYK